MAPEGWVTEGTRTFLFADLRDYTGFVERHGDRKAADLVAAYRKLIRERVHETRGAEIKVEGDAMFVVFPSARQAIACAAAILSDAAVRTHAEPDLPMRVGIGLHAGEPVAQEGDFIGAAVNVAARIAAAAGAGQLLISELVRALVRTGAPFPMRDRGPVTLKGLSEPIRLYEVVWSDVPPTDSAELLEGSVIPYPQPPHFAAPGSRLVGRNDELGLLQSRGAALTGGSGGTLLLAGDAGIGKSRLLREAFFGPTSSAAILYGACGLSEAPPPYEPFVAIVRGIIRAANGEAALQGVAPELLALSPESAMSRQQAPDRDRLFGAFLRVLRQYARARPTIVVIEDLHWADEATLAMLQFLIAEAEPTPYLVVATYRSDELHRRHRMRPFLAALARRSDVATVALAPLPADQALQLLHALPALKEAPAAELEAINHRAAGNPLFLEELAETHQLGRSGVPASVAETVLQRVARAGENAERLLRYLAVTGARANYDILEPLMGEEAALLEGARAGVEEHLVQEDGDGLAFRHALIREAILGDLMSRERRALHRSVGEAMERLHKGDPEYAGDIAQHLGSAGLAERALPFALTAGERALRLHAPEEAARIYEHAAEWSRPSTVDRMRALEGLGRAYGRDLFVKKATATYQEALDLARSVGTQEDVARITLRLTFVMPWGKEEYASWQAAWAAAEPLDQPATLARIASGLARRAYLYLEDDRGAAWLERALSEARRAGGRGQELFALRLRLQYEHRPGWQAEEEAHIREQLELALWDDDGVLSMYTDFYVRRCRESDEDERERVLQTGREYADRLAIPEGIVFRYGIAWVNWLTGRWDRARALSEVIRSRWSDDASVVYPSVGPIAACVAIESDGPEAGRRHLLESTERLRRTGTWRALLWAAAHEANVLLADGRPVEVLESFKPILERRPPSMHDIEDFTLTTRVVLPAALLAGDRTVLAMWTDDETVAAGGALYEAGVDHARAISALLDGNPEIADASFARAAAAYLDRGWLLLGHELAWQRWRTGSRSASDPFDAAVAFYEAQGATWRIRWLAERRHAAVGGT
ncbi:MAG TPA: AAA family ATPase [Candidatus Dormibacteraeota bacterium]|nr:AAA family ATPase [Candidatus Dormibacteraeota bacterium]